MSLTLKSTNMLHRWKERRRHSGFSISSPLRRGEVVDAESEAGDEADLKRPVTSPNRPATSPLILRNVDSHGGAKSLDIGRVNEQGIRTTSAKDERSGLESTPETPRTKMSVESGTEDSIQHIIDEAVRKTMESFLEHEKGVTVRLDLEKQDRQKEHDATRRSEIELQKRMEKLGESILRAENRNGQLIDKLHSRDERMETYVEEMMSIVRGYETRLRTLEKEIVDRDLREAIRFGEMSNEIRESSNALENRVWNVEAGLGKKVDTISRKLASLSEDLKRSMEHNQVHKQTSSDNVRSGTGKHTVVNHQSYPAVSDDFRVKLENIEGILKTIETKQTIAKTSEHGMRGDMQSIRESFDQLDTTSLRSQVRKIDALERHVTALRKELDVQGTLASLDSKLLSTHTARFDAMSTYSKKVLTALQGIDASIKAGTDEQKIMTDRLETLTDDTRTLHENHANLQDRLAIIHDRTLSLDTIITDTLAPRLLQRNDVSAVIKTLLPGFDTALLSRIDDKVNGISGALDIATTHHSELLTKQDASIERVHERLTTAASREQDASSEMQMTMALVKTELMEQSKLQLSLLDTLSQNQNLSQHEIVSSTRECLDKLDLAFAALDQAGGGREEKHSRMTDFYNGLSESHDHFIADQARRFDQLQTELSNLQDNTTAQAETLRNLKDALHDETMDSLRNVNENIERQSSKSHEDIEALVRLNTQLRESHTDMSNQLASSTALIETGLKSVFSTQEHRHAEIIQSLLSTDTELGELTKRLSKDVSSIQSSLMSNHQKAAEQLASLLEAVGHVKANDSLWRAKLGECNDSILLHTSQVSEEIAGLRQAVAPKGSSLGQDQMEISREIRGILDTILQQKKDVEILQELKAMRGIDDANFESILERLDVLHEHDPTQAIAALSVNLADMHKGRRDEEILSEIRTSRSENQANAAAINNANTTISTIVSVVEGIQTNDKGDEILSEIKAMRGVDDANFESILEQLDLAREQNPSAVLSDIASMLRGIRSSYKGAEILREVKAMRGVDDANFDTILEQLDQLREQDQSNKLLAGIQIVQQHHGDTRKMFSELSQIVSASETAAIDRAARCQEQLSSIENMVLFSKNDETMAGIAQDLKRALEQRNVISAELQAINRILEAYVQQSQESDDRLNSTVVKTGDSNNAAIQALQGLINAAFKEERTSTDASIHDLGSQLRDEHQKFNDVIRSISNMLTANTTALETGFNNASTGMARIENMHTATGERFSGIVAQITDCHYATVETRSRLTSLVEEVQKQGNKRADEQHQETIKAISSTAADLRQQYLDTNTELEDAFTQSARKQFDLSREVLSAIGPISNDLETFKTEFETGLDTLRLQSSEKHDAVCKLVAEEAAKGREERTNVTQSTHDLVRDLDEKLTPIPQLLPSIRMNSAALSRIDSRLCGTNTTFKELLLEGNGRVLHNLKHLEKQFDAVTAIHDSCTDIRDVVTSIDDHLSDMKIELNDQRADTRERMDYIGQQVEGTEKGIEIIGKRVIGTRKAWEEAMSGFGAGVGSASASSTLRGLPRDWLKDIADDGMTDGERSPVGFGRHQREGSGSPGRFRNAGARKMDRGQTVAGAAAAQLLKIQARDEQAERPSGLRVTSFS